MYKRSRLALQTAYDFLTRAEIIIFCLCIHIFYYSNMFYTVRSMKHSGIFVMKVYLNIEREVYGHI